MEATRSPGDTRVADLISAVARLVCKEPTAAAAAHRLVKAWAKRGYERPTVCVMTALGRCADPSVLRRLIELWGGDLLQRTVRMHLPYVLAQRRDAVLQLRAGSGIAVGDTMLDASIAESFVVDALLGWLDDAEREIAQGLPTDPEECARVLGARLNVLRALGPSSGTHASVTRVYRAYLDGSIPVAASTRSMILLSMSAAEAPAGVADVARSVFHTASTADVLEQAGNALLRGEDPADANAVLTFAMDESRSVDLRVAALLAFQGVPLVVRDGRVLAALGRLGHYVQEFAELHGERDRLLPIMSYLYGAHAPRIEGLSSVCARFVLSFAMSEKTDSPRAQGALASFRGRQGRQWFPELFDELQQQSRVSRGGLIALARLAHKFNARPEWAKGSFAVIDRAAARLEQTEYSEVRSLLAALR